MELIDKSDLVAEIKRIRDKAFPNSDWNHGYVKACESIISLLNTLEVKEVDLDFQTFAKEMETVFALSSSKTENTEEEPLNWEYAIAKHFFELGLKAKGE